MKKDEVKTKKQLIGELQDLRRDIEALKRSEAEYRQIGESQEKFAKAFVQNSIPMALTTFQEGRFVDVSDAFLKFAGFRRDEVIGRTAIGIGLLSREQGTFFSNELIKKGRIDNLELQVRIKNGLSRDGLFNAVLMTFNNEKYLLSVMTDVTEFRRVQEALWTSEIQYAHLVDHISDGVYRLNRSGYFTFINKVIADRSGISPEKFYTLHYLDVVVPQDRERVKANFEKVMQGIAIAPYELSYTKADGGTMSVETNSNPIYEKGEIAGLQGISRDITERKREEEALSAEHQRLASILDGSPVSSFVIDNGRRIIAWNRANEFFTGISKTDVLGKPIDLRRLFRGRSVTVLADLVLAMSDEEIIKRYGHKGLHKSVVHPEAIEGIGPIWIGKDKRIMAIQATRLRDAGGNVIGAVQCAEDITERRRAEEDLQKAQKLESIGTLAGGIAHDFNNLLAAIQGYIELAKIDVPQGGKVHHRLTAAENTVAQASELTGRLITFARGGDPIKKRSHVKDLIRDAVSLSIGESAVEKRFYLKGDLWPVEIDEGQIHQVIRNLALNALESMPAGGLLTVRAENVRVEAGDRLPLNSGSYIRMSIQDTGSGIPAEALQLIFDPYFSTKKRGTAKGMGLGLSVCHSVISKHNGCILVESEPGRGSTFHVYLPACMLDAPPVREKSDRDKTMEKTRILVMDDEPMIRNMLSELLAAMGYDVQTAGDGLTAIDLYRKAMQLRQPFRAVILDLSIPGGLGGKLTMERLLEIDSAARGIVLSGYIDDPVIHDFRQYGFLGALTKPFTLKKLQDLLEKL